jgi:ribosomal protein S25
VGVENMFEYRNSYGQRIVVGQGQMEHLKDRSFEAVLPEVVEVISRLFHGRQAKHILPKNVGHELNVKIDVINHVLEHLSNVGVLRAIGSKKIYSIVNINTP